MIETLTGIFNFDNQTLIEEDNFSSELIWSIATQENLDIDQFINAFSQGLEIRNELVRDAGVLEEISISQHTKFVLTQFEKYFAASLSDFARAFMRIFLVLHDLGKARTLFIHGHVGNQHAATKPMMERVFNLLGAKAGLEMALGLLQQDFIGNYLMYGYDNPRETAQMIRDRAEELDLEVSFYYSLVRNFHLSDAGAYTLDAGSVKALDFLFIFKNGTIDYSSVASQRPSNKSKRSPKELMDDLERELGLNN